MPIEHNNNAIFICETAVYFLIFKSVNPSIKAFALWLRQSLFPQARMTGSFAPKPEKFTRSIMSAARMIFSAAGLKGNNLALALDKIALHYTGKSMLALSEVVLENPERETESETEQSNRRTEI